MAWLTKNAHDQISSLLYNVTTNYHTTVFSVITTPQNYLKTTKNTATMLH